MAYSPLTSFPPLTTTFTPPASCSTAPWTYVTVVDTVSGAATTSSSSTITTLSQPFEGGAQLPTDSLTASFDPEACLPSGYYEGEGHYSPGICPYGQTTATAIQTAGTSVAICCPSGYTATDENQDCVSTYTASTTVNYFVIPQDYLDNANGTIGVTQGATVGPGVLVIRAAVMLLPSAISTSSIAAATSVATNSSQISGTDVSSSYQSTGLSNTAIIGITVAVAVTVLGLIMLGYSLLQRRTSRQTNKGDFSSLRIGNVLMIPVTVAILVGIATCLLASHRNWQDEIIRRWDSPNSVIRVVQVLSFIIRICAGVLAWCCVADIGWLMISRGLKPAQMVRVFDMAASGGSYATAWDALWINLRKLSWTTSSVLILAIAIALTSDLVGNAIIASTGVGYIVGRNNTVSNIPFVQVGYVNRDNSTFGSVDQVVPISSSANYYSQILQINNSFAFLPIQAGAALPSSYSGNAYFGSLTTECSPAALNGSVNIANYISTGDAASYDNTFGMDGLLDIPFENIASPQNISFYKQPITFTRTSISNPQPILGAWMIPQSNANSSIQYIATLLVSNLNESFVEADMYNAPSSNGSLIINDAQSPCEGESGGTFAIQVCRLTLPSTFGTISAPEISQEPLPPPFPCSLGTAICPNITVYDAGPGATITAWSDDELLANLNASYTDFQTASQIMDPFQDGVLFCKECNATGIAARVLSSYVADAAGGSNFSAAMKTALLHSIAFTYRNELPTLNGLGTAIFTLLQPATIVINPTWIYCSIAYVFVLILVTVLLRAYTLSVVGVERSGSVLSAASLITHPSPLAYVVQKGSTKRGDVLRQDVDSKVPDEKLMLGALKSEQTRFGIGFVGDVLRWRRSGHREIISGSQEAKTKEQSDSLLNSDEQKTVSSETVPRRRSPSQEISLGSNENAS